MNRRKHATIKRRLMAFGLGCVVLIISGAAAFGSSGDLRVIFATAAVLLLGLATWLGAQERIDWFGAILLALPVFAGFSFLLLVRLPALWPQLIFWGIALFLGLVAVKAVRSRHALVLGVAIALFCAVSLWYCILYLPGLIAGKLNHFRNVSAPTFKLEGVGPGAVAVTSEPGKILVMDFFATWCRPCKTELPELTAVRDELKKDSDIHFVLVGSNVGGDTAERLRLFAQTRNVTLPLAFDPDGKTRNSFGVTGFPSIVVIDRMGKVRLTREGYNPAETNFRRDMIQFLRTL